MCVCVCVCVFTCMFYFLSLKELCDSSHLKFFSFSRHLTISASPFLLVILFFSSLYITIICFQNLHIHWGLKILPLPIVLYSNCNPSLKLNDRNSKWQLLKSASVGEASVLLISRNSSEANISLLNRLLSSVKLIEFDHLIAMGIANLLCVR